MCVCAFNLCLHSLRKMRAVWPQPFEHRLLLFCWYLWTSEYFISRIRFSVSRKQPAINEPQATQWINKIFNSQSLGINIAHLTYQNHTPVLRKIICKWKITYGNMKLTNKSHYIIYWHFNAVFSALIKSKAYRIMGGFNQNGKKLLQSPLELS